MTNCDPKNDTRVFLDYIQDYHDSLTEKVFRVLNNTITQVPQNSKVLIKPNFISPKNCLLACTHPEIIRAVAIYFQESENKVIIGDSPAFGTARAIYKKIDPDYRSLPADIVNFNKTTQIKLPFGGKMPFSSHVLESDYLVNLAKLKVHNQMRMSAAVKNVFGCVPGTRKAVAHAQYGDKSNLFEQMILSLGKHLPRSCHMLEGIQAMHKSGPTNGLPYQLGIVGASVNSIALDTAIYSVLGLSPEQVPLWKESQRQDLTGSRSKDLIYPGYTPEQFYTQGFLIPDRLSPVSFHPARLAKSTLKRFILSLKDTTLAR